MFLKKTAAVVAALMMTASPVLAQSNTVPAPQPETVSAPNNLQGAPEYLGWVVGATIVGIILYILVNAGEDDEDDDDGGAPVSP